ncbi:AbrB/MazE/SpoVT family DNA-binding domain-containing protein [Dryocola clanedunensis]|uniref:AbrB/MazE/SpoVT family DNA-binding domain-containing protein n=1 Tax=Cedecea sulfonylureivorans TaxID=3051154 RepID=UPI00192805F2|nr:AbrB/MazE/SpoVT family DNA-binding domain-containing protein [Cedecea sulfonylureivorans]
MEIHKLQAVKHCSVGGACYDEFKHCLIEASAMKTLIRKWGNSAGAIIPVAVLDRAGMKLGDKVEIEAVEGGILLRAAKPVYTLEQLLAQSPEGSFELDDEDREWLNAKPVGKERE